MSEKNSFLIEKILIIR